MAAEKQNAVENTRGNVQRRSVLKAAAWTAPVVAISAAAPFAAASGELREYQIAQIEDYWNAAPGQNFTGLVFALTSTDGTGVAGRTFTATVPSAGPVQFNNATTFNGPRSATFTTDGNGEFEITNLWRKTQSTQNGSFNLTLTPVTTGYDSDTETAPVTLVVSILDRRSIDFSLRSGISPTSAVATPAYPNSSTTPTGSWSAAGKANARVGGTAYPYLHYLISEGLGWNSSSTAPTITREFEIVSGAHWYVSGTTWTTQWTDSSSQTGNRYNYLNNLYRTSDDDIVVNVTVTFANTVNSNGVPITPTPTATFTHQIVIPNTGTEVV